MLWKSVLVVLLSCSVGFAQVEPEITGDKVLFPVTLSPSTYLKPVSKSYLLPEYSEIQPGSKIQGFLKCFMEQQIFFGQEQELKRDKFLQMKMADLPKNVREECGVNNGVAYNPQYTNFMVMMDRAARYSRTEWNEWFDLRKDGVYFLLPEVQKLRSLASVLRLRMRGEIKNHEFERAIATARTLFGLAKGLEEHPTLIGNLVGMAIATICLNAIEEMIQEPGCPNLFWAFVDMPKNVIDTRHGISGERLLITAQIESLTKAQRVLTDEEVESVIKYVEELVKFPSTTGPDNAIDKVLSQPRVRYALFASDIKRVEDARKRIVATGVPESVVKKFPPLQVILHDDHLEYEILRDEVLKWVNLPLYQARVGNAESEMLIKARRKEAILGPLAVAASWSVQQARERINQRVAYLRTMEAIRLHAYENKGQLPAKLSDIKLPLCDDPVSGKPFTYSVAGDVATLTGENPNRGNPRTNRVYEVRIRK
jgi:hypothetical protein